MDTERNDRRREVDGDEGAGEIVVDEKGKRGRREREMGWEGKNIERKKERKGQEEKEEVW